MTDKDKLDAVRAEIHRLVDVRCYDREMANDLFTFIDSLPNEPISDDLEEAADNAFNIVLNNHEIVNLRSCMEMFKYGAKWQKTKDESTTEDLGEYINELSKQFPEVSFAKLSRIAVRVAKWQKQQMMEKAIEGKVIANGMGNPILHLWDKGKHLIDKKVKVILIKED